MILPSFSGPGGLYFVVFGSLFAEEPGWRGFAQLRLQMRYGALIASVVVGLLWSSRHLWYVILPGGLSNVTGTDAVATYLRLISTAIVYAWRGCTTAQTGACSSRCLPISGTTSPRVLYRYPPTEADSI